MPNWFAYETVAGGINKALCVCGVHKRASELVAALIYLALASFVAANVLPLFIHQVWRFTQTPEQTFSTAPTTTAQYAQTNTGSSTGIQVNGDNATVYSDSDIKRRLNIKSISGVPLLKDDE